MLQLVKFADLKAMLDLEKESLDDYPALKLLIASVYAAFESYLARTLEFGSYTETVHVDGKMVSLRATPVQTVTAATLDGAATALDGHVKRVHGLTLATPLTGELVVSYTGGLEAAPDDLRRAALMQVLHEYARKDHVGATSVTNEGGSTSWPELGLLKEVKRLLDAHVHPARYL